LHIDENNQKVAMRKLLQELWESICWAAEFVPGLIMWAVLIWAVVHYVDVGQAIETLCGFALCLLVPVVVLEIMDWRKKAKELDRIKEENREEQERVKRDAARAVEGLAK